MSKDKRHKASYTLDTNVGWHTIVVWRIQPSLDSKEMNESQALKSLRQAGIGLNVSQCGSCSNTYVSPTKH